MLDACLAQDPDSRVACETCTKTGMVMVFGEITTKANVDYEAVVRKACSDIGYDDAEKGLDFKTMEVMNKLEEQSPDIGQSVHGMGTKSAPEDIGAGDQVEGERVVLAIVLRRFSCSCIQLECTEQFRTNEVGVHPRLLLTMTFISASTTGPHVRVRV